MAWSIQVSAKSPCDRIGICDLEKLLSENSRVLITPTAAPAEKRALCSASGSTFPARNK